MFKSLHHQRYFCCNRRHTKSSEQYTSSTPSLEECAKQTWRQIPRLSMYSCCHFREFFFFLSASNLPNWTKHTLHFLTFEYVYIYAHAYLFLYIYYMYIYKCIVFFIDQFISIVCCSSHVGPLCQLLPFISSLLTSFVCFHLFPPQKKSCHSFLPSKKTVPFF